MGSDRHSLKRNRAPDDDLLGLEFLKDLFVASAQPILSLPMSADAPVVMPIPVLDASVNPAAVAL
jgi:hypothetical protein